MKTLGLDFPEFKKIVKERLASRTLRVLENPGYKASAVLILFMDSGDGPRILVTRRTHNVGTHKGQMSLPGGGKDSCDADILQTALRETREETGIPPEKIEVLGRFDDFISIFGFHVAVFAGAVDYPCDYDFNPGEIDAHVEAPFSLFAERKYDKVNYYTHEGREIRMYHYFYEGHEIWGLTARILTDFAEEIIERYAEKDSASARDSAKRKKSLC